MYLYIIYHLLANKLTQALKSKSTLLLNPHTPMKPDPTNVLQTLINQRRNKTKNLSLHLNKHTKEKLIIFIKQCYKKNIFNSYLPY